MAHSTSDWFKNWMINFLRWTLSPGSSLKAGRSIPGRIVCSIAETGRVLKNGSWNWNERNRNNDTWPHGRDAYDQGFDKSQRGLCRRLQMWQTESVFWITQGNFRKCKNHYVTLAQTFSFRSSFSCLLIIYSFPQCKFYGSHGISMKSNSHVVLVKGNKVIFSIELSSPRVVLW